MTERARLEAPFLGVAGWKPIGSKVLLIRGLFLIFLFHFIKLLFVFFSFFKFLCIKLLFFSCAHEANLFVDTSTLNNRDFTI